MIESPQSLRRSSSGRTRRTILPKMAYGFSFVSSLRCVDLKLIDVCDGFHLTNTASVTQK